MNTLNKQIAVLFCACSFFVFMAGSGLVFADDARDEKLAPYNQRLQAINAALANRPLRFTNETAFEEEVNFLNQQMETARERLKEYLHVAYDDSDDHEKVVNSVDRQYQQWRSNLDDNIVPLVKIGLTPEFARIALFYHYLQDLFYFGESNKTETRAKLIIQKTANVNAANGPYTAIISPDRTIAVIGDTAYEMPSGRELWTGNLGGLCPTFINNDILLDCRSYDDVGENITIRLINPQTGAVMLETDQGVQEILNWSAPGRNLAFKQTVWNGTNFDSTLKFIDLQENRIMDKPVSFTDYRNGTSLPVEESVRNFGEKLYQRFPELRAVASSQDQSVLLCAHKSNKSAPLIVYELFKDKAYQIYSSADKNGVPLTAEILTRGKRTGFDFEIERVFFSPRSSLLSLAGSDGLWYFFMAAPDGSGFDLLGKIKPRSGYKLEAVMNDDSSKPLVTVSNLRNGQVMIWEIDFTNKGAINELPIAQDTTTEISAFALSVDDYCLTATKAGGVFLIDLNTGGLSPIKVPDGIIVTAACFSGDGQTLFLGTDNGQILIIREGLLDKSISTGLKQITQMAADISGGNVWAASSLGELPRSGGLPSARPTKNRANLVKLSVSDMKVAKYPNALGLVPKIIAAGNKVTVLSIASVPHVGGNIKLPECSMKTWGNDNSNILTCSATEGVLWSPTLSPDGRHFVFAGDPVNYSPDYFGAAGHYVFDFSSRQNIVLKERKSYIDIFTDYYPGFEERTAFSADGELVALSSSRFDGGFILRVVNTKNGDEVMRLENSQAYPYPIQGGAFLHNSPRLVTVAADGLRLWSLDSKPELVEMLRWTFFKNGNLVVMDQDYRYDTPDPEPEKLEGLHWVARHIPGKTLALASLMRDYYQPRLAEYVLAGKKLPELPSIDELNLNQHGVKLVGVEPEKDTPGKVAVTVEVYVRSDDANHPAQELKLFRDGQLVDKYTGDNNGLFDLPDGKRQVTFHNIALPQNKNQVKFKAWAFNEDGVRSKYFDRPYIYQPAGKTEPKLHLVSVGVDNFDNPAWDLQYAGNDAKGFAGTIPASLPAVKADVALLASGEGLTKPSKESLKNALRNLADGGSSPDDVVLLTISSHGLTDDADNKFYIIPADIPGQEKKITPELLAHSISADELGDWLTGVDAAEIIMVLDTCQSGAALGGETFKPGPMGDKGLGQMAYDKAMRVLSATNENNAAMELGNLGHGLLSYALLVDGLEQGRAGGQAGFTFKEWLTYGKERTTELYTKIASGEGLGETRGKVKVEKATDNTNPPLGQEPYLFDFGGADKEVMRFQAK